MNEGRWIDANGTRFLLDKSRGESRKLFLDPLTATYSRRYFETYLTHMEGMECVEIIDVNQFKQVNDTYGHPAGDVVLRDIAAAIKSCIRSSDILVRYGGDEFLLILTGIPSGVLRAKLEQIRDRVHDVGERYGREEQKNQSSCGEYFIYRISDLASVSQYRRCLWCPSDNGGHSPGRQTDV